MSKKIVVKYGIYSYSVLGIDKVLTNYQVPVKVIEETNKSYKIKLLGFAKNRVPNQTLWVTKRKVKINKTVVGEENNSDDNVEEYWWQRL